MKDKMGNWLKGDREIADYIRNGFLELFSTNQCSAPLSDWYPPFWQVSLHVDDAERLASSITNIEVRSTLWSLKPNKALGPDGLHAGFFQCLWHIVGDFVKDEVKHIFSSRKIPDYLNKTLITLIPKCPNPKSIGNYRPISLCNSIYKVVTKIIVAHIRLKLPDLVSSLQTAFVPGKN